MNKQASTLIDTDGQAIPDAAVAALRARLQQQVDELSAKDSELRARLAAEESATANTFVAGTEGAMAAETDDEVIALLHHEQMELAAAREALGRMAAGDYGFCAECGEAIGLKRLEVVPEAHLCVGCQDMAEHRKGH
jgi:DnaK suppressor protein